MPKAQDVQFASRELVVRETLVETVSNLTVMAVLISVPIWGARKGWSNLRIGMVSGFIIAPIFGIRVIGRLVLFVIGGQVSPSSSVVGIFLGSIGTLLTGLILGAVITGVVGVIRTVLARSS